MTVLVSPYFVLFNLQEPARALTVSHLLALDFRGPRAWVRT